MHILPPQRTARLHVQSCSCQGLQQTPVLGCQQHALVGVHHGQAQHSRDGRLQLLHALHQLAALSTHLEVSPPQIPAETGRQDQLACWASIHYL